MRLCVFPYREDSWVLESKILCVLCRSERTYFPRAYVYSDTEIPPPQLQKKKNKTPKSFQHGIKVSLNDSFQIPKSGPP